jgi:hypothetical protein
MALVDKWTPQSEDNLPRFALIQMSVGWTLMGWLIVICRGDFFPLAIRPFMGGRVFWSYPVSSLVRSVLQFMQFTHPKRLSV